MRRIQRLGLLQGRKEILDLELNSCAVVAKMVFKVAPRLIEYPAIEIPEELLEENIAPFSVEEALFLLRVYAN